MCRPDVPYVMGIVIEVAVAVRAAQAAVAHLRLDLLISI